MNNIQIVTDSTAYFPREEAEKRNIKIIPLSVNFCGEAASEGFPGEFEQFFEKLKTSQEFPTTSQPSTDAFVRVFEEAISEGKEVIAILISSKLSGTYNNACMAASMLSTDKISIVDSETSVSNLRFLVEIAWELAQEGKSRHEIVDAIEKEKEKAGIRLTVDNLDYLRKGGRLTGAQAFVGTMLNIKPVIGLSEGKLIPIEKVMGKKKAIKSMISSIPDNVKRISICHILNMEEAEELKQILQEKYPNASVSIDEVGPVIGSHLGPKAIGICYKW